MSFLEKSVQAYVLPNRRPPFSITNRRRKRCLLSRLKHQYLDSRNTQHTKREDMIHLESMKREDEVANRNAMAMERGEEIAEAEMP